MLDEVFISHLYEEILKLTKRAIEAETLLEFERSKHPTPFPGAEETGESNES